MKCELCKLDNLAPDHWMSFMHMDLQIKYERANLKDLNDNV